MALIAIDGWPDVVWVKDENGWVYTDNKEIQLLGYHSIFLVNPAWVPSNKTNDGRWWKVVKKQSSLIFWFWQWWRNRGEANCGNTEGESGYGQVYCSRYRGHRGKCRYP